MILIDSVSLNLGPGSSSRTSLGTDEQLLSIGSKCLIEPFRATICQVWRLRKKEARVVKTRFLKGAFIRRFTAFSNLVRRQRPVHNLFIHIVAY